MTVPNGTMGFLGNAIKLVQNDLLVDYDYSSPEKDIWPNNDAFVEDGGYLETPALNEDLEGFTFEPSIYEFISSL